LIRRADGRGRLAAVEVLVNNSAIANMIRDGKTEQIPSSKRHESNNSDFVNNAVNVPPNWQ
jgi:Tfp pilus assembly pilus retraction ATPase PilT